MWISSNCSWLFWNVSHLFHFKEDWILRLQWSRVPICVTLQKCQLNSGLRLNQIYLPITVDFQILLLQDQIRILLHAHIIAIKAKEVYYKSFLLLSLLRSLLRIPLLFSVHHCFEMQIFSDLSLSRGKKHFDSSMMCQIADIQD